MSIQVLNPSQYLNNFTEDADIRINPFSKAFTFDSFDLTIVNLQDKDIWVNQENNYKSTSHQSDIDTLSAMINNTGTCKILLLLPMDYTFKYNAINGRYSKRISLRDMLQQLNHDILEGLYKKKVDLAFGRSETEMNGRTYSADFHLHDSSDCRIKPLLPKSNAGTTTCFQIDEHLFATTLLMDSNDALLELCNALELLPREDAALPDWLGEIHIFDEEQLRTSLAVLSDKIAELDDEKQQIENTLGDYSETKSILCKKDFELEEQAKRMLQELLEITVDFEDTKEEDFRYETDSDVYVFEIKGAVGGLKRQHISKAHDHTQIVQDELDDAASKKTARGVLLFSGQINTPPSQRDSYPDKQITLAERDEIAVISTETFLRCYEAHQEGKLSKEEFLDLISVSGLTRYGE